MVYARLTLTDYANRVLNVIKGRFGFNDKSQAFNRFIELYGEEFVEKEASDKYLKKFLETEERHFKKYGNRKMSLKELDELCGV